MIKLETIEKISKKYSDSTDDFILHGSNLAMKESQIPEHPGWEDLIEIKNIEICFRKSRRAHSKNP